MSLEVMPFTEHQPKPKSEAEVVLERARELQAEIGRAALLYSEIGKHYNEIIEEVLQNRQQMKNLDLHIDENEYYHKAPRVDEGTRFAAQALIDQVISRGFDESASPHEAPRKSHLHIVE